MGYVLMSAPQQVQPAALLPYQRTMIAQMAGRRWGKMSAMMQGVPSLQQYARLGRSLNGLKTAFIIHDEYDGRLRSVLQPFNADLSQTDEDHRNQWFRDGRYRRPPIQKRVVAAEPGMVQVRNRRGDLEWRKLGNGMVKATEAARMRDNPLWGAF